MLHIATAEYFESLKCFLKHMPTQKDTELVVLKGHLLIERLLEKYLNQNLAQPSALENAGLSFNQKLSFVAALHHDTNDEWLWGGIRKLNRLRNELAHRLESPKLLTLVEDFIVHVEENPEFPSFEAPTEITERLQRTIFAIHETMSYRVDL